MVLNDAGVIGLSLDGKSFPATTPIVANVGDWIRLTYFNEGLQVHPMHLHGFEQIVVAKDGEPLDHPYAADTVLVAPGERYTVLFNADRHPARGCGTATSSTTSNRPTACSAWSPRSSSSSDPTPEHRCEDGRHVFRAERTTMHRIDTAPLSATELAGIDAYWRAANYLSVGQIYLLDNPLLREPLQPEHIKPRLLGHWGTTPGLNLPLRPPQPGDRAPRDLDVIYITGPGHGGPAVVANAWLEGTYCERYPGRLPRRAGHAPAVPAVLLPRRHSQPRGPGDARARSTRAASWATRWPTPTAPRSTTPICWWPA